MKNTFWISTAPRTGSMWLFNVVKKYSTLINIMYFLARYQNMIRSFRNLQLKSLLDKDDSNKYVFKVHSPLKSDLPNSKILTTIRDLEMCAHPLENL